MDTYKVTTDIHAEGFFNSEVVKADFFEVTHEGYLMLQTRGYNNNGSSDSVAAFKNWISVLKIDPSEEL